MNNIFFASDPHFCHNKEFLYGPRGFSNEWEMNEALIKNWNNIVKYNDTVYLLGDIMLCNNEEGLNCLRRLNGNIKIILGNHDTNNRIELYKELYNIDILGYAAVEKLEGYRFYLSHYPTLTSNADDNDKPLKKKTINLCGHSHTSDKWYHWSQGLIYHVEFDAHKNSPVPLEVVIEDLNKQYYK